MPVVRERKAVIIVLLFSLFLLGSMLGVVFASSVMWSQTYGGEGGDYAHSVIETADGGFVIAGYTNSFRTFGTTIYDSWLIKTDANGNVIWNQTYGAGILQSLVETSKGELAFVANNRFVKTDSYGNTLWNMTYGSAILYSLVETSDGGFAIAGSIYSFDDSSYDFLLIKIDTNGNAEWNKTYNNGVDEKAHSLVETFDGGYAIVGVTSYLDIATSPFDNYSNFWLVKTDVNGNTEWNQTFSETKTEIAYSLIQTSDMGYAIAGRTHYKMDIWVVKTDSNGNMTWSKTYGGAYGDEQVFSLIETSNGGLALAASTNSYGSGSLDFWLVKIDIDGNVEWSQTYGGSNTDKAHSLVETSDGGYAIAGETCSFGAGDSDFWLVKTNEQGIIPEFPSWIILPLTMILALVVIVRKKTMLKGRKE